MKRTWTWEEIREGIEDNEIMRVENKREIPGSGWSGLVWVRETRELIRQLRDGTSVELFSFYD